MLIRPAQAEDLGALTKIYNHYVLTSHVTFDTESFSVAERQPWFAQFDGGRYQCWIAELNGAIAGYACSQNFKAKVAYQTSVEVSVYLAPGHGSKGGGRMLYDKLLGRLAGQDLHRAYAGVAQPNEASMRLHAALGFEEAARFSEVGRKFERYWDVVWLERAL